MDSVILGSDISETFRKRSRSRGSFSLFVELIEFCVHLTVTIASVVEETGELIPFRNICNGCKLRSERIANSFELANPILVAPFGLSLRLSLLGFDGTRGLKLCHRCRRRWRPGK
jgi:hypothetical protein